MEHEFGLLLLDKAVSVINDINLFRDTAIEYRDKKVVAEIAVANTAFDLLYVRCKQLNMSTVCIF